MMATSRPWAIEPGFWVAVRLRDYGGALRSAPVGEVQAVDAQGFRLTLVDWVIGAFCSWDLWVPWTEVKSMLVATPAHDRDRFLDHAAKLQNAEKSAHVGSLVE